MTHRPCTLLSQADHLLRNTSASLNHESMLLFFVFFIPPSHCSHLLHLIPKKSILSWQRKTTIIYLYTLKGFQRNSAQHTPTGPELLHATATPATATRGPSAKQDGSTSLRSAAAFKSGCSLPHDYSSNSTDLFRSDWEVGERSPIVSRLFSATVTTPQSHDS